MSAVPSPAVVEAFGVGGEPEALPGGQRTVWRFGGTGLKALDLVPAAVPWQAAVLGSVPPDAPIRVAPPQQAVDGRWIVDGWTAWRYEPATRRDGAWPSIAAAGRALSELARDVPPPSWLDQRDDPWQRAESTCWSDELAPADVPGAAAGLVPLLRPIDLPNTMIHGDLSGNVEFAGDGRPVVFDLSPQWRPIAFGAAVVAIDAMLLHGATDRVLDAMAESEPNVTAQQFAQLAARAVLFRLFSAAFARPDRTPQDLDREFAAVSRAMAVRLGD